jgi:seryl-tRNA synthetase
MAAVNGLIRTDAPGVHVLDDALERTVVAVRQLVDTMAAKEGFHPLSVPPVIARSILEKTGYAEAFPQLLGSVFGLEERGTGKLVPTDVVVLPAACYHVYPALSGATLTGPARYVAHGTCYRHESTLEQGRLRSFRMSELVFVGAAEETIAWRERWLHRTEQLFRDLGLEVVVEVASDPFFGPGQRWLRATQREQQLKFELIAPVGEGMRQAIASCNYHKDHFGEKFEITTAGQAAHTSCVGFGLERVAMALTHAHGPDRKRWPDAVRALVQASDD